MNFLYTLTTYPPSTGGAQLLQHLLAQQFLPHHSIQVVSHWDNNRSDWLLGTTLTSPTQARDYVIDGIPVHRMGLSWQDKLYDLPFVLLYYPLMDVALPPISRRMEPHLEPYAARADLIHNVRIGREALSYASLQVARKHNIPFVLTPVHHPRWTGWRYRAYDRLYKMADCVLALTNAEKQILLQIGVREERIAVIGMGSILAPTADPHRFRQRHHIDGPIVLFLGQHYPYKGYRQVLEATTAVWQKVPEAQFVFIGPPVKGSEQIFADYPVGRIHRLGKVDLQEKTDALAACTLLCMPSTQESFGGVYTEAWAFGKPVIGCAIPAVRDVIEDGKDGFLVEQKAGPIADQILKLLSDPRLAQQMGLAGQRKVNERFTWPMIAQRTERAYLATLQGKLLS